MQAVRKIDSHELKDVFTKEWVRCAELNMRICRRRDLLHGVARAPLPRVQPERVGVPERHRPRALRLLAPASATRSRSAGPAASATSPPCARGCPRWRTCCAPARRPASSPSARRFAGELAGRVRPRTVPQPAVRVARGLPRVDEHVRRRARAVGQQQPVPRQERPALARGERARRSRSSATPPSTRRSRTASPAWPPPPWRRPRPRCSRSSTTRRAAARWAPPRARTSPSTAASRWPRSAGPRSCARRAPAKAAAVA